MTNIWDFLLYTLTVSAVAGMILLIKKLFEDKLTPRWHYGIWCLLALRSLLPVSVQNRYILLPVPLWVETWKFRFELGAGSAYTDPFSVVSRVGPFPRISVLPKSAADWLFLIYTAGVLARLLWDVIVYFRLRMVVNAAKGSSAAAQEKAEATANKFSLRSCSAVIMPGADSAFVYGVFRPVLVLPKGAEVDEKVILHELLHLKYKDALQNVAWALLRAVHWCNPFMHYIFNVIGNDLEALCDRRVMERLQGEDRRNYGKILLSMANERYPRAVGTTSISNGGKNIAHRIACIARFKKYPKGMELVSICMAMLMVHPFFVGAAMKDTEADVGDNSLSALQAAMASTRVLRCTTPGGAVDTYAKGIIYDNGLYIAMASPLSMQQDLYDALCKNLQPKEGEAPWRYTHYEYGLPGIANRGNADIASPFANQYGLYNLKRTDEGYTGTLMIQMQAVYRTEQEAADGKSVYYQNENGSNCVGYMALPISVYRESTGWVTAPTGSSKVFLHDEFMEPWENLECLLFEGKGVYGNVKAEVRIENKVLCDDSDLVSEDVWHGFFRNSFTEKPDRAAEIVQRAFLIKTEYQFNGDPRGVAYTTLETMLYTKNETIPPLNEPMDGSLFAPIRVNSDGGSSTGWSYNAETYSDTEWDGCITDSNWVFIEEGMEATASDMVIGVRAHIDGCETEQIILREVK